MESSFIENSVEQTYLPLKVRSRFVEICSYIQKKFIYFNFNKIKINLILYVFSTTKMLGMDQTE